MDSNKIESLIVYYLIISEARFFITTGSQNFGGFVLQFTASRGSDIPDDWLQVGEITHMSMLIVFYHNQTINFSKDLFIFWGKVIYIFLLIHTHSLKEKNEFFVDSLIKKECTLCG